MAAVVFAAETSCSKLLATLLGHRIVFARGSGCRRGQRFLSPASIGAFFATRACVPFCTGGRLVLQGGRPCLRTRPSFICRVCFESACWRANRKTALRRRLRPSGAAPGSGDDVCQPASSRYFLGPTARTRPLGPRRQLFLDRMCVGTQRALILCPPPPSCVGCSARSH